MKRIKNNLSIISFFGLFIFVFSCSKLEIEPVEKSDIILAKSPKLEELEKITEGSFIVNSDYNGKRAIYYLQGVIVSDLVNGEKIHNGVVHFNDFSYSGGLTENYNYPIYNTNPYDQIQSSGLPELYGSNITVWLENDEGNIFQGEEIYIPQEIRINVDPTIDPETTYYNLPNDVISWNADPNNEVGVIIGVKSHISGSDIKYYITEDDGSVSVSQLIKDLSFNLDDPSSNKLTIYFYRGNGFVISGNDNRKYKSMVISSHAVAYEINE